MADEAERIARALASGNTSRGWVTRQRTAITALIATVGNSPSRDGIQRIRDRLTKMAENVEKGTRAFNEAIELEEDPADVANYTARLAEMETAALQTEQAALTAIAAAEQALAPPAPAVVGAAAAPGGGGGGARMQDSLKPERLTVDASPVDVTRWKKEFGTYFRRSMVHTWPALEDQHNVFTGCLDRELANKLTSDPLYAVNRRVLKSDPPLGDSLEELLDGIFLQEVPLFARRLEFWCMRQEEGQTVDQFAELLENRAREADVATMNRDDMITFRLLTGVTDRGMLREWRRLENPTLEDMKRTLRVYLAGCRQEKARKSQAGAAGGAAKAARQEERSPSRGRRNRRDRSSSRPPIPEALRNLCIRCGAADHRVANCNKKRSDTKCTGCGMRGHLVKVCFKAHRDPTPGAKTPAAKA